MKSCQRQSPVLLQQLCFTLIELIVTLILISILAVTALPRFMGSNGFTEVALRDELANRLRAVQLSAMNSADGHCHLLVIQTDQWGVSPRSAASCPAYPLQWITEFDPHQVSIAPAVIGFDRLGRATLDCSGGCDLSIVGRDSTETVRIESEGFIHAL